MRLIFSVVSFIPVALAVSSRNIEISVKDVTASNIINVHLQYSESVFGNHTFTYGNCDTVGLSDWGHYIATVSNSGSPGDDKRLVWVVPDNVSPGGCISAWDPEGALLGQSEPLSLDSILNAGLAKRDRVSMTNESGIDAEGPWFNGVTLLKNKEIGAVDVKKTKEKCMLSRYHIVLIANDG